jgi:putative sigma-54 modulation protein
VDVHVSGRGVPITPALRSRIETKLAKVARFLPKITEVRVVLGRERHRHLTAVTVQAKGATLHAEAAGADFFSALDEAVEPLAEQARRHKERIRTRKPRALRRTPAPAGAEPPPEPAPDLLIRRLAAKPMSVDEALEQMRTRRDNVLVFTNARSRALNVLRRRRDGRLELVQPAG